MRFRKFAAALLAAALACYGGALVASAAVPEHKACLSDLTVQVCCTGEIPQETLQIRLAGLDGAPMPEDAAGDHWYAQDDEHQTLMQYSFRTGPATEGQQMRIRVPIPQIVYSEPGVYRYYITQTGGSDPNAVYDPTSYLLRVTASWENGRFGVTTAVFALDENGGSVGEKLPGVRFENRYPQPTPPETPPVEPPEETTTGQPPAETTEKLIQTGQLHWPVPVLAGGGALLTAAGVFCRRRQEDEDA